MARSVLYRGYTANCRICSRKFRAETSIGIDALLKEHEKDCERETIAKERRELNTKLAAAAQPGLFDDITRKP
jgi:hypothetical protein